MKCVSCGESLSTDDKFCTGCGSPIAAEVASPKQMFCTECGKPLDLGTKFCIHCGTATADQGQPEPEVRPLPAKQQAPKDPAPKPAVEPPPPAPFKANTEKVPTPASIPSTTVHKKPAVDAPESAPPKPRATRPTTAQPVTLVPAPAAKSAPELSASTQPSDPQPQRNGSSVKLGGVVAALILAGAGGYFLASNKQTAAPVAPSNAVLPARASPIAPAAPTAQVQQPAPAQAADSATPPALPTASAEAKVAGQPPAKDAASSNRALEAPTATGADLLNLATSGNWQSFQAAAVVLMDQPKPATGDRKVARALNDQAVTLAVSEIQKSLALLRQAHAADPADVEIADNLGMVLRMARNYDQSEAQLMKVITTWPNRQTAWANLGQTLSVQNKRREAVGAYVASYKVSKNPQKVLEVYKRIVDDPLDKEDPQMRKDLNAALEIIKSTSN